MRTLAAAVALAVSVTACSASTAGSGSGGSVAAAASPDASSTSPYSSTPATPATPATSTVSFHGVTVPNPTDLSRSPRATSHATAAPPALEVRDLVVGTGPAATPTSTVRVQYDGLLYRTGVEFDSTWSRNATPTEFPLTRVVPGFASGIAGHGAITPMHVGGRRLMIIPAALGYGHTANGAIPADAPLVFVVDLVSVS